MENKQVLLCALVGVAAYFGLQLLKAGSLTTMFMYLSGKSSETSHGHVGEVSR